ncbi:sigma-E factor negative regulatory protein [Paraburkholderia bonniea]|uniref:sigma-E factor negative regulatory protein n=1 Tax=Paraburkholderia bonniea TaxID=2152891 RepID=UPI002573C766|nr:sigma-E factor negative regulatory protein [Paraburkholderia bonniea]WJF89489.1 sigma-E factor negative regulatory protein [Paraburkholderia bonniea]WJF92804.1 sigma-E factor negative regulatory protein [Paraburkholderia bonniea]
MGSVSMQSEIQSQAGTQANASRERLSAIVDGELSGEADLKQFLASLNFADRAAWSQYHLIGDALRSDDLALSPAVSSAFFSRFAERFEHEPHVLAPAAPRMAALRRRMVPAFAVAAAAAALTWIVVPQLQRPGATQIASATASNDSASVQRVALVSAAPAQPVTLDAGNIIRDAGLDQYLEAHQQFAQQPVMAGSMPLIRTAAVTTQGQ